MGRCTSICSRPRPELERHSIADRMDRRHHSFAETIKFPHRVHMRVLRRSTTQGFSIFASANKLRWHSPSGCSRMSASLSKAGTSLLAKKHLILCGRARRRGLFELEYIWSDAEHISNPPTGISAAALISTTENRAWL